MASQFIITPPEYCHPFVCNSSAGKFPKFGPALSAKTCRSGVAGFLIGNAAEEILHRVDCSVPRVKGCFTTSNCGYLQQAAGTYEMYGRYVILL